LGNGARFLSMRSISTTPNAGANMSNRQDRLINWPPANWRFPTVERQFFTGIDLSIARLKIAQREAGANQAERL
jgi:hypothetical protein